MWATIEPLKGVIMTKQRKIPEKIDVWAFFGSYFNKKVEEREIEANKLRYIMGRVDYFDEDLSKIKFIRRS